MKGAVDRGVVAATAAATAVSKETEAVMAAVRIGIPEAIVVNTRTTANTVGSRHAGEQRPLVEESRPHPGLPRALLESTGVMLTYRVIARTRRSMVDRALAHMCPTK